jgi:AcrR family transcriptional regulator
MDASSVAILEADSGTTTMESERRSSTRRSQTRRIAKAEMVTTKPNKHEMKTKETRAKLLRAAEELIVRHGYENADMAQIAALAGKTTGAIYAHFKSKEEIFLALFDESLEHKSKIAERVVQKTASKEQKRKMWRNVLLEINKDKKWSLLLLEFKLFAIRHPEAQGRLQERTRTIFGGGPDSLPYVMLEATNNKGALQDKIFAVRMMQPLLSALAVERQLYPNDIDEASVNRYLLRLFDSLI